MRPPTQYPLTFPERRERPAERLDLATSLNLEFEPRDEERFPTLRLGHEVARTGGTVLEYHNFDSNPTLADLHLLDNWARKEIEKWVCT